MMWVRRSSSKLTRGGEGGKLGETGAEKVERWGERGSGDMAAMAVDCFKGERNWVGAVVEDRVWGARWCIGCLDGEAGASAVSQGSRWERLVAFCDEPKDGVKEEVAEEEEVVVEEDSPMAVVALCTATASATLRAAARARATAV